MAEENAAKREQNLPLIACIALCMLAPLSGLAHSGISPIMPQITGHFAAVPGAGVLVRLMATGLSAAMIFGALVSGVLAERLGQLRLLYIALALFALGGAAGFVLDNLYLMVASRIVLGVANATAGVLAMALVTTCVAESARDRWMGFYIVTGNVGSLVFVTAAGALGHIDWRLVFLLHLLALPVALFIGLTFTGQPAASGKANPRAVKGGGIPWDWTAFGLLCGAVGTSTFIFLPFHLATIGLGDPAKVASLIMISMLFGSIMAFSFGWIRKYLSVVAVFVVGFATTGAGLLLALAVSSYPVLLVAAAVFGGGFGMVTPNLFAAAGAATTPELRPRFIGFVRAGFYAGPLVAQFILELVLRRNGPAGAVLGIALAAFGAAALSLLARGLFAPARPEPA